MLIIKRDLFSHILSRIKPGRVVIINGARRTGKTFLLGELLKELKTQYLLLNGDDFSTARLLSNRTAGNYRQLIGSKRLFVIDEAQKVPEIGQVLKLIVDEIPEIMVVVTGSSAFDLTNMTGEPLTGRKVSFTLYPFSENEHAQLEDLVNRQDKLDQRLIYGCYPELIRLENESEKKEYLNELVSSYLLKDILAFENIRHSAKIFNLLRLIAHQTGNLVSLNELGTQLSMSKNTVEKYMDLLSRTFVLFRIEGYSRNLRKEITKNSKWYFYDNGIRNAVIANTNRLDLRADAGQLWENYMISERIKYMQNNRLHSNNFFWRTYDQQEIDWIEERDGMLKGYEFKLTDSKAKAPVAWTKAYPEAQFKVINQHNYHAWLTEGAD